MTLLVLAASGPSLTVEQCAMVESVRARGQCHVLVVNRTWEMLPRADVLYAADARWWDAYWPRVEAEFAGECWTCNDASAKRYGLCFVRCEFRSGLSTNSAIVHGGGNGGYQALNLARHFLAADPDPVKRIALIGYDMQHTGGRRHWHDDYTDRVVEGRKVSFGNAGSAPTWAKNFDSTVSQLRDERIDVVNCTRETGLTCFRRGDLSQTLRTQ